MDIESNYEKKQNIIIPENNYLYEFYVTGDTLYIYDLAQYKTLFYSISEKKFICSNCLDYNENKDTLQSIWDLLFKVREIGDSEFVFEIYDSNRVKIKTNTLDTNIYYADEANIIYKNNQICLMVLCNSLYIFDKSSLELTLSSNVRGSYVIEDNILYNYQWGSYSDTVVVNFSKDYGIKWEIFKLYGKLSNNYHITDCTQIPNSHKVIIIDENLYSFSVDTLFYAKVGDEQLVVIGDYKISRYERFKDLVYFFDEKTNSIYELKDKNNIKKFNLRNLTKRKLTSMDLNNGYLYVTDLYNLFRLKLE